MLRFLEAGLVAAARQFAAIIAVTLITGLLVSRGVISLGDWATGSDPPELCQFVSQFLGRAYLLTAVGLTLTRARSITVTAERIRHASRLVSPEHGSAVLAVQLVLCAI